jgi:hypothetical protein
MQRSTAILLILLSLLSTPLLAGRKTKKERVLDMTTIVIHVRRNDGQLELSFDGKKFSKKELNFQLGEQHLDSARNRRVIVMLDARTTFISDIKIVPEMAVNAGFTDMQAFAVFPDMGNMAEILYGPVRQISDHPDSHQANSSDEAKNTVKGISR